MEVFVRFARTWWSAGLEMYHRGDPLLMGAAIAYNSLFALVPLAAAFVAIITLFDGSDAVFERFVDFLYSALPADIAAFLEELLNQSADLVQEDRVVVFIVSMLIALWSGSRAVYAIQKSLRLVQGLPEERGYLVTRSLGVAVTIGAGLSVMVGYTVLIFGDRALEAIADFLGIADIGVAQILLSIVVIVWMFGLLYVIYRFGPPQAVDYPAITSGVVAGTLVIGTRLAVRVVPEVNSDAIAVFGTLGIVLVWLYFLGVVVVGVPMMVGATKAAIDGLGTPLASRGD